MAGTSRSARPTSFPDRVRTSVPRRNRPPGMSEVPPPGRNKRRGAWGCGETWWHLALADLLTSLTTPPPSPHTAALSPAADTPTWGGPTHTHLPGHHGPASKGHLWGSDLSARSHSSMEKRYKVWGSGAHPIHTHDFWALPGSDLVWVPCDTGETRDSNSQRNAQPQEPVFGPLPSTFFPSWPLGAYQGGSSPLPPQGSHSKHLGSGDAGGWGGMMGKHHW